MNITKKAIGAVAIIYAVLLCVQSMQYENSFKWVADVLGSVTTITTAVTYAPTGYIAAFLLIISGVIGFLATNSFYPTFVSGILYALSGAVNIFGLNQQFYPFRTIPAIAFMVAGLLVIGSLFFNNNSSAD